MEFHQKLKHPGSKVEQNSEIWMTFIHNNGIIFNQIRDRLQKISQTKKMDFNISEFKAGRNEKFIGAMVTQFNFAPQNSFEIFSKNIQDYLVCLKSDGLRYLLAIFSNGKTIFIDRENNLSEVETDLNTNSIASEAGDLGVIEYILDGELIVNYSNFGSQEKLHFQIFDFILNRKNLIIDLNCMERLSQCQRFLNQMRFFSHISSQTENKNDDKIYVYLKDFYSARDSHFPLQQLSKIQPYVDNIDGLIFTKINYPYCPGRNLGMIKWKTEQMNTVDFLIVENNQLILPYQTFFPPDSFFIFELYVINKAHYILFDYLFVFSVDEYIEICRHFKVFSIGETEVEGIVMECAYNKTESNPCIKTFYDQFYEMSSDCLIGMINSSKLAKFSNRDNEALKPLLTSFEQRIDFNESKFCGNWVSSRIRADKNFPNALATANNVYESIFEKNISEKTLLKAIKS